QRKLVYAAVQRLPADLPDHLPEAIRARFDYPSRMAALVAAHFPPDGASLEALNQFATPAQQRLIFEEAFLFQTGVMARRRSAAAADEPPARGRRRGGKDDRGAPGGSGRDGERTAGRLHGADRDPGRAALLQHLAALADVAVSRRAADRRDRERPAPGTARGRA